MAKRKAVPAETSDTTSRSSKRRKAAQVSMSKVKAIAAADEEPSSDTEERADIKRITLHASKGRRTAEAEPQNAPPPTLSEKIAKFNTGTLTFPEMVDVLRREAFTLKPLTLVEGPHQGRHVLMLEPVPAFRFLDLPPEIRTMIYGLVLEEPNEVAVSTYKPKLKPRRPVRQTFIPGPYTKEKNLSWNAEDGKWEGRDPSGLALLGVSDAVREEAAAIAYGNNTFRFNTFAESDLFLETIGPMRMHIRDITFGNMRSYMRTKASSTFRQLTIATHLRSITIDHELICSILGWRSRACSPEILVQAMKSLLKALHKAQKAGDSPSDVLDLIHLTSTKCFVCKGTKPRPGGPIECISTHTYRQCKVACKDLPDHCDVIKEKIRSIMKKDLGVKT